jgi:hypothetical protein
MLGAWRQTTAEGDEQRHSEMKCQSPSESLLGVGGQHTVATGVLTLSKHPRKVPAPGHTGKAIGTRSRSCRHELSIGASIVASTPTSRGHRQKTALRDMRSRSREPGAAWLSPAYRERMQARREGECEAEPSDPRSMVGSDLWRARAVPRAWKEVEAGRRP